MKSGVPVAEVKDVVWNETQNGLSLGYRIIGDEWRILGNDVKVELWVQNPGDKDVKFQLNMRPDLGLRMKLKSENGEEQESNIVPTDVPPFGEHRLLQPGHALKVKEFTVSLLWLENDVSGIKGHYFAIDPGAYHFHCELELPGFSATGEGGKQLTPAEGEWTGKLTTRSLNVTVITPDAPAPKPPIEQVEVGITKEGEISLDRVKMPLAELTTRAARNAKKWFRIDADEDVPYAKVIEVVEALKAVGVTTFSFREARVGDGKYRVANRTGNYDFDGNRKFSICQPFELKQWFTVIWPATDGEPARNLRMYPNASEQSRGTWAVVWEPGTDVLWWVDDSDLGKMTLTDPARIVVEREARSGGFSREFALPEGVLTEFRRLGFDVGGGNGEAKRSREVLSAQTVSEKPTRASVPKLPKLPDDAYAKPGVHCQKFREEDAKRPGGELMGAVLEPSKAADREKEALVLGVRAASDAQWRIGSTAKVGLVVRNRSDSDVKFAYTLRYDNWLSVVAVDEAGKEHNAAIAQDGLLVFQRMLLSAAHVATIAEFTIRFDPEKRDVSEAHVRAFHLTPGKYKLRFKWNDARLEIAHEGEWTGELVNEELEFTLAVALAADDAKPVAADGAAAKNGALSPIRARDAWSVELLALSKVVAESRGMGEAKADDVIAWGKEEDGLRSGLLLPGRAKLGEKVTPLLVLKNVSGATKEMKVCTSLNVLEPTVHSLDGKTFIETLKVQLRGVDAQFPVTLKAGEHIEFAGPPVLFGVERDAEGKPLTPDWPVAGVVMGAETVRVKFHLGNVRGPETGEVTVEVKALGANIIKVPDDQYVKSGLPMAEVPVARHSGSIVSHVDSYGSGTGGSQHLANLGQMNAGFDYGDSSKTDWKGSIKWRYLRKESNSDVYKVEWEYKPKGGSPTHKVDELSFDGVSSAKLVVNKQWVISIEPDQPPVKAKSGTR